MKKKYGKEKGIMVSVEDRKGIKIVGFQREVVTDEEMKVFERNLDNKIEQYNNFSDYCINSNLLKNKEYNDDNYKDAIKSMEEHNKLLKNILKNSKMN